MQLELKMMGENPAQSWIKAVYEPDDLSQEDRAVLDRYFDFGTIQIRRLTVMRELGLAEEDLGDWFDDMNWQLGNEAGRRGREPSLFGQNAPSVLSFEWLEVVAGSTGRRNTLIKPFGRRFVVERLSGTLIEFPSHGVELGLRVCR